jgi:NADPH:quinone reductase-like Zn-dependent oxidoreductase
VQLAGLQRGDVLLVHGGASGIGTMATQVGRWLGARVLVTAGSAEKLALCAEFGAEAGINYRDEDFATRVRELTEDHGADVILDIIGAKYLRPNVSALAMGGRLVVIGLQGGATAELDLGVLLAKRALVAATALRSRPVAEKGAIVAAVARDLWPAIESGEVRPVVDRVLPLAEAGEAHRVVAASEHVGKVLLTA